jgi:hypothetical protein
VAQLLVLLTLVALLSPVFSSPESISLWRPRTTSSTACTYSVSSRWMDAVKRSCTLSAVLFKQQRLRTTNGQFRVQRAFIQPHVHIHRASHAATAILLKLAGEFRQGAGFNDPLLIVPVVEQVQEF